MTQITQQYTKFEFLTIQELAKKNDTNKRKILRKKYFVILKKCLLFFLIFQIKMLSLHFSNINVMIPAGGVKDLEQRLAEIRRHL